MKIAYFVNQYPKVSHSFIRREINAMEKQGVDVVRYALRTDESELVDVNDKVELNRTTYLLKYPFYSFLAASITILASNPFHFFCTIKNLFKIGIRSDRGIFRHFIYFLEACLLTKLTTSKNITHIHAHFGTNSATVVMLAKLLGGPNYSFTVHGPEEFDKPQFISISEKIKHSSFVVAISSYGKSQLFRWVEHKYWDKVKIIHCGLESEFYNVAIPPTRQNKRMICVGRLCEQKGQLLLVEAVAKLVEEGEKIQLVLAGDGPMRRDIEELIEDKRISDNVTITGWIGSDRVRSEILDSAFLVLPSFAEGLPVVIMESMAMERPVITTYIAGIPELVLPGENGWLVPAGSLDLLVSTIRTAINSPDEELQRLGRNARQRVIERHNIDLEAQKLATYIYEIS